MTLEDQPGQPPLFLVRARSPHAAGRLPAIGARWSTPAHRLCWPPRRMHQIQDNRHTPQGRPPPPDPPLPPQIAPRHLPAASRRHECRRHGPACRPEIGAEAAAPPKRRPPRRSAAPQLLQMRRRSYHAMVPGRTTPQLGEDGPRRSFGRGDEEASPAAGDNQTLSGCALGRRGRRRERLGGGGRWRLGFPLPSPRGGEREGCFREPI